MTFRDLHDRLTARGITVGVDVDRRGHAIVLEDPDSLRAARMRVPDAGFDRAATKLVVSARLQELLCGGCDWPELTRQ